MSTDRTFRQKQLKDLSKVSSQLRSLRAGIKAATGAGIENLLLMSEDRLAVSSNKSRLSHQNIICRLKNQRCHKIKSDREEKPQKIWAYNKPWQKTDRL